ncbi:MULTISPECIES: MbcA/ParS/Xre antitoxin family protein [Shewanella]|uniref:MbcA/ParS/Xre antitoxin family protein n=2 Tax=Shewanella TaxID=22 RepID=A0AAJ1BH66_9GAMM|nr:MULTISPECIES: MbcA/ParS/Xre antitoxin family protein [Shewanella]AZQ11882.1 hypothetical protein STH12_02813 [Shewanella khirikhana]MCH4294671.1 MbcA/ParS/Xre antitoxin family protein [Shewanella zhuhaiensis]
MSAIAKPTASTVLFKAFINACHALELSNSEASHIIGVNPSTLSRNASQGFKPESKQGELQLQLVRLYRSLYAIAGGQQDFMRHWINSPNHALGGTPRELVKSVVGLVSVNQYLDAMRGKV